MGIKFFEEYPSHAVPKKIYEKVTPHLWEIKAHYGDEQFRLYSFKDEALVIAAVGVQKKWQKARSSDLELAETRRQDYWQRKKAAKKAHEPSEGDFQPERTRNEHERHRKVYRRPESAKPQGVG